MEEKWFVMVESSRAEGIINKIKERLGTLSEQFEFASIPRFQHRVVICMGFERMGGAYNEVDDLVDRFVGRVTKALATLTPNMAIAAAS